MRKIPFLARDENRDHEVAEETLELPREVAMFTVELIPRVAAVQDRLDDLHDKFDASLREDTAKDQLFNQLYEDMQARRREQLEDHLLPLVRSILLVIDRIDAQRTSSAVVDEGMATLRDELLDALYAVGVEPIVVAPDARDSRLQRIVETVPAGDHAWVERRSGYVLGTRVIRPQQIAVRGDVAEETPA